MSERPPLHDFDSGISEPVSSSIGTALEHARSKIRADQPFTEAELQELRHSLDQARGELNKKTDRLYWEILNPTIPFDLPQKDGYKTVDGFENVYGTPAGALGPELLVSINKSGGGEAMAVIHSVSDHTSEPKKAVPSTTEVHQITPNSFILRTRSAVHQFTYDQATKSLSEREIYTSLFRPLRYLPNGTMIGVEGNSTQDNLKISIYTPTESSWERQETLRWVPAPGSSITAEQAYDIMRSRSHDGTKYLPATGIYLPKKHIQGDSPPTRIVLNNDSTFTLIPVPDATLLDSNILPDGRVSRVDREKVTLLPTKFCRDPALGTDEIYDDPNNTSPNIRLRQVGPNRFFLIQVSEILILEKVDGRWQETEKFGNVNETILQVVVFPDGRVLVMYESARNGKPFTVIYDGKTREQPTQGA